MLGLLRRAASPATVLAALALFIAAGGTGYAVTKLPKNSVGTVQIKDKAVTTPKLNPAAAARLAGLTYRRYTFVVGPGMGAVADATCPKGLVAIGGGVETPHMPNVFVLDGHPIGTAWETSVGNASDAPQSVNAYAICARAEAGAPATARAATPDTVRTFRLTGAR
jgi:hypothetical protein